MAGSATATDDEVRELLKDQVGDLPRRSPVAGGKVDMTALLCDLLGALGIVLPQGKGDSDFRPALYEAVMLKVRELTGQGVPAPGTPTPTPAPASKPKAPANPLIPGGADEVQPVGLSLGAGLERLRLENAALRLELAGSIPRDPTPAEADAIALGLASLMGAAAPAAQTDDDALADLLVPRGRY